MTNNLINTIRKKFEIEFQFRSKEYLIINLMINKLINKFN